MSGLLKALPGSTTYLVNHPRALLLKLNSDANTSLGSATQIPIPPTQARPNKEDDLITFIIPHFLKASASLQAALLSIPPPSPPTSVEFEPIVDDATQLWQNRKALTTSLEGLIAKSVVALAENGVRLEWEAAGQSVKGGVGKAREVVHKLVNMIQGRST